jgi:murein DD-endopeptidase MepM/ murein hydrolase activator NlpD
VVSVIDGFPDVEIGKRDAENPAGNHLMLETASGARLLLCHLRRGSIAVHQGQNVEAGQVLAEVGNSGNTTEPHLHIQAMARADDGTWVGIPIEIRGDILHRGQLLRYPSPPDGAGERTRPRQPAHLSG